MITAEILLARESGPVLLTISVNTAVDTLPERGLMSATESTQGESPALPGSQQELSLPYQKLRTTEMP